MDNLRVEEFLKNVRNHEMRIQLDQGVRRHIVFKNPKSLNMWFELVTWPGTLCYNGDMGTFVFTRLNDMFEFFRRESPARTYSISYSYWAEKLQSADRADGGQARVYSPDVFRQNVKEVLEQFIEQREMSGDLADELRCSVRRDVLSCADNGFDRAMESALEFTHNDLPVFPDFWEHSCDEYTLRFLWCCYALRWAIVQYDEHHATLEGQAVEEVAKK